MNRPRSFLALVVATALLSLALPQASAVHNNQGTVKVHDNEDENPDMRNVPHVDCEFWIEGFNLGDDSGWIVFFAWPPTGDKSVVESGEDQEWVADPWDETHGFHFLAGPFTLESGHYRVEVYTDEGHPGATADGSDQHFAKAKTFWVECEEEPVVNPPCPPGLTVEARSTSGTADIFLDWDAVEGAEGYNVYRAVAGGDFEYQVTIDAPATSYVDDHDIVVGTTYEYYVTAVVGGVESVNCEIVEATAIPFFPSLAVGALALLGGVGAFVLMRRRS